MDAKQVGLIVLALVLMLVAGVWLAVLGHASVDSARHYAMTSRRRLDAAIGSLHDAPPGFGKV